MLGFKAYRQDLGDYMRRWILLTPWGTVRLHHILKSDADPEPHDHPWHFWSILLRGSYVEYLYEPTVPANHIDTQIRVPFMPRRVAADTLHRLQLMRPVWTLVITGPKIRDWGFQTDQGWMPWRQFVTQKQGFDVDAYEAKLREVYGGE